MSGFNHFRSISLFAGAVLISLPSFVYSQTLVQRTFHPRSTYNPSQSTNLTVNLTYDKGSITDMAVGSNSTIIGGIPSELVNLGQAPRNPRANSSQISLTTSISNATGQVSFSFVDDETASVIIFSYDITIPAGNHGDLVFPTVSDTVQINYFNSIFEEINVRQSVGGNDTLSEVTVLTVSVQADNGTVTVTPNKAQYTPGEEIEFLATPDSFYQFIEWQGDLSGDENPKTINIENNMDVMAVFALGPYHPADTNLDFKISDSEKNSYFSRATLIVREGFKAKGFDSVGYEYHWDGSKYVPGLPSGR